MSTRILFAGIALLVYLVVLRPIRLAVTEHAVYPQVKSMATDDAEFSSSFESGALLLYYEFKDESKQLQYRPEFGFFFLVAFMSLLFITTRRKPFWILATLHLAGSVLAFLFLMVGAAGIQTGFIFTDIISGYLTPALSLALVPLVMKGKNIEG